MDGRATDMAIEGAAGGTDRQTLPGPAGWRRVDPRRVTWSVAAWAAAMVLAAWIDRPVAEWVHRSAAAYAVAHNWFVHHPLKALGNYLVALALAAVVFWAIDRGRRVSGAWLMILSGLAGLVMSLLKWGVGRTRPFKLDPHDVAQPFTLLPFRGGLPGLFAQSNLSFPSGHATTAFATATALGLILPRGRWAFYALAACVAAQRVLENAHWTSDVVAGAALGHLGVLAVLAALRGWLAHLDAVWRRWRGAPDAPPGTTPKAML